MRRFPDATHGERIEYAAMAVAALAHEEADATVYLGGEGFAAAVYRRACELIEERAELLEVPVGEFVEADHAS